jgi:hypothetical protein
MEDLLHPLLERIATAMEKMATTEKRHYDLYQRECAKSETRYREDQKVVREQKRIQAESIKRSERIEAALQRADSRQEFAHDFSKTALGLTAPDYVPKDIGTT